MPIFAAVGTAILGASGAAAAGATATAVVGGLAIAGTAAAVGTSIYGANAQAAAAKKQANAMAASLSSYQAGDVGRITGQEAQDTVSKRLARAGKYFTSPLGDTSSLSTASQKVFS